MGHKGAAKFNGARPRKITPREGELITSADVDSAMDVAQKDSVRELAGRYTEKAVLTLARVMNSKQSTWGSKVSAAKAILEYAHGKPSQQIHVPRGDGGGLKIQIIQFATGKKEDLEIAMADGLAKAVAAEVVVDVPVAD